MATLCHLPSIEGYHFQKMKNKKVFTKEKRAPIDNIEIQFKDIEEKKRGIYHVGKDYEKHAFTHYY